MSKIALHTHNLSIGHKGKAVVENVNLEAKQGEFICLTGRNGTGKSTLLKTLSGLIEPVSGDVFIGNVKLTDLSS
ncbi:MAG: ATP-binding cassette domain-containing protein, partial [Bacteroidia bacterium]|nr:ATP-binding cassette domain-containing protein [Bacteroidia bacterium]